MFKTLRVGGLALAIAAGGWFVLKNFDINGLDKVAVNPKRDGMFANGAAGPAARDSEAIRVASFNIQVFGEKKLADANVVAVLAAIARQFDVIAIQEVRAASQDILPRFCDAINAEGRRYDYAIGPRLGRTSSKEQYAFVFDTETIEIDRGSMYTIDDPGDRLHREPLVAGFRVRGPEPNEAFTFTLIDIHTDPDETGPELDALADVLRAVQSDGRGEDDIILLGDLNVDDAHLGNLGRLSDIGYVISGQATNTMGTKQYDNIVFNLKATTEFTGRGGVFDMLKQFNLDQTQAQQVSDHMPVWAEFNSREGGETGRLARTSQPTAKSSSAARRSRTQ